MLEAPSLETTNRLVRSLSSTAKTHNDVPPTQYNRCSFRAIESAGKPKKVDNYITAIVLHYDLQQLYLFHS